MVELCGNSPLSDRAAWHAEQAALFSIKEDCEDRREMALRHAAKAIAFNIFPRGTALREVNHYAEQLVKDMQGGVIKEMIDE